MKNILILGANGQIARLAEENFLSNTDDHLTLFLRKAERLSDMKSDRVQVVEGDASKTRDLNDVMKNIDVVYANLAGKNIKAQAQAVVSSM